MSDKLHLQSGFFYLFILSRDFCTKCCQAKYFHLKTKNLMLFNTNTNLLLETTVNRVLRMLY